MGRGRNRTEPVMKEEGCVHWECTRLLARSRNGKQGSEVAQLGQKGLTLDAYLQFTGQTEQKLREDAKPEAINSLRIQKAADRIALLEGIAATDEDYANELAAICRQNRMTMEQLRPHINAQFEGSVRDNIRMQKAIAFVRANARVTVVDAPASKE